MNPFCTGDTVMLCKHIYEQSSCRVVVGGVSFKDIEARRKPVSFIRSDGTRGHADGCAACRACVDEAVAANKDGTDYIETLYTDGRFHVADFHRSPA